MDNLPLPTPQPREVTVNGQRYNLVAFYYPGRNTAWDKVYCGQFLGNFYPCPLTLTIDGITASFCTSEAAYQATKWWDNSGERAKFEKAATGKQAWKIAQQLKKLLPPDDSYAGLGRDGAMRQVLRQKFSKPAFQQALLLTGQAYLLEHSETPVEAYWSDYHNGTGANRLGETLMSIRASLGGAPAPAGNYTVAQFTAQVETQP